MAELDGLWIAAMLAADAHMEAGPRLASLGRAHLYQLTNALLIECGEGILLEDARLQISRQEVVDVIAADAEGGLRQVVGSEAEELSLFGDLIGGQGRARQFDHGAHLVINGFTLLLEDFRGHAADDRRLVAHFFNGADERNHDFRMRIAALALDGDSGLKEGAHLHLGDLGEGDAEAAATQSEHGVDLAQILDPRQQSAQFLQPGRMGLGVLQMGDFHQQIRALGQELMQRRIEQANGHR